MLNVKISHSCIMSKVHSRIFVLKLLSTLILTINIQTSSARIKTTLEILQKHGYGAQLHTVITKDGYKLELHRIYENKTGKTPTRNYPVLIPNCFMGSSAVYVLGGPERSLPMQLADDGFDVWLANSRGNKYSRKHLWLSVKENPYWNFTLHELGVFDLPAIIDKILKETKKKKLHYIGYSMSTTTFFILASQKTEYHEKIRSHISLAPVSNIVHATSSMKYLAKHTKLLNKLLPKIIEHFPAGTSSKLMAHYSQFIASERFGQYDYGPEKNVQQYNSIYAPSYNLNLVNVPTTLMYSENDLLANPTDVERLKDQLPQVMDVIKVDNKYFNHLDFVWSIKVTELVNDPVKKTLYKTDDISWEYTKY